ncbi:hypothetical protein [Metallibacterium scheffleri]
MNSGPADRLAQVRELALRNAGLEDFGLIRAIVKCLDQAQASELLEAEAGNSTRLRDAALRKVVADIKGEFAAFHQALVEKLLERLQVAPATTRQGIAFCLSSLLPSLPDDLKLGVIRAFVGSKYAGIRRRGYKALGKEVVSSSEIVCGIWQASQDPETAWLAARFLPMSQLLEHREEIDALLTEGWQISRLYLRLYEVDATSLRHLLVRDGICYAYVTAKLGKTLEVSEAMELVVKYAGDERFGLLLWSFGEMRLWEVLKSLGKD